MKIELYFKSARVGVLEQKENKFSFVFDKAGYESVKHFPSVIAAVEVGGLVEGEGDSVPQFFITEFVTNIRQRQDICSDGEIAASDSDMLVLYKYANLKQNDIKFHIKRSLVWLI